MKAASNTKCIQTTRGVISFHTDVSSHQDMKQ